MTSTLDTIAARFSSRSFTGDPVPVDILQAIVTAGLHAPSAMNRQPWRLIVISKKEEVDAIGAVGLERLKDADPAGYERILGRGGKLLYDAPAMIVVALAPQPGAFSADLDGGILTSHLLLAARDLGVDSCTVGLAGFAFADETLKTKYIPAGFEFGIAVLLGYATAPGTGHAIDESKVIWA
ncbi:MAG: nitroreductase family protein [Propionibacteriaceae bacterium]|jgi:nitroreductase|nr:nitroreductase family protein [Propionibacteriaceae bacterium]